ncbi:MAG: hypothetical protein ACOX6O_05165 [Christensenellales bacterium]
MHETGGLRRFMDKRMWALMLVAVMLINMSGACASGFDSLGAADELQGLAGEAAISLETWPDISPETLRVMQGWLEGLRLKLYAGEACGVLGLYDGPRQVFLAEDVDERLTLTAPGSLAPTEYVGSSAEAPPLQTLFDFPPLPDFGPLTASLPRWGEALLEGLRPYEKADEVKTRIKTVGRADSRLVYALGAEEANAWWQQTLPRLLPLWAEGAAGLPKAWRDEGALLLSSLRFTGKLTIRQLLDKEGAALGFQAISTLEVLGQTRKLDVIAAYQEGTGLHLSLKLPAVRGRDRLEALISLAFAKKEAVTPIKGELSFIQSTGGDKLSLTGQADLSLTPEGAGERLGGMITLKLNRTGDTAQKREHQLQPDLLIGESGLAGSLKWVESEGKKLLRDVSLRLELMKAQEMPVTSVPQVRVDLRQADQTALAHARRQAGQALLPWIREKLLALPLETRRLVLHDWGRVRRALAESNQDMISAPQTDSFIVVDDADTQPVTKEDLP